jgi:hypothetical protein
MAVRGVLTLLVLATIGAPAQAESLRSTVVLRARADQKGDDAKAYAEVVSALRALHVADVLAEAPLDLEAVQLAIDCMEDSARCMREVAKRTHARVVIVPALTHHADSLDLGISFFDSEGDEAPRKAVRRQRGDQLDKSTIDAIPGMLRDLFGVEGDAAPAQAEPEPVKDTQPAPVEQHVQASSRRGLPFGPLLLGGVGLASVVAGLTVGALMQKTENAYAAQLITTQQQAAAADVQRARGEREALVANVLLGAGVAAILAGGIWFVTGLGKHEDEPAQARIAPVLGLDRAGLSVSGTWEALR